ncbi:uncharacterized protein METZ01_LOCUS45855, partial [marine metagenome]
VSLRHQHLEPPSPLALLAFGELHSATVLSSPALLEPFQSRLRRRRQCDHRYIADMFPKPIQLLGLTHPVDKHVRLLQGTHQTWNKPVNHNLLTVLLAHRESRHAYVLGSLRQALRGHLCAHDVAQ